MTGDVGLPDPPIAADVDLRDFPFMPLDVPRLRRSKAWLYAKRRPEIGFYMINLWCSSWHEVPAGSLEDDDDVLADLAMCSLEKWPRVRAAALRGWVKSKDGRLYHAVVVEKAIEAWSQKWARPDRASNRSEHARKAARARWEKEQALREQCPTDARAMPEQCPDDALRGTGTGNKRSSDPNGSAPNGATLDPVKELFDVGVRLITGAGRSEKDARGLVGKWRKSVGDAELSALLVVAVRKTDPVPWLISAVAEVTRRKEKPYGDAML